MEKYGTFKAFVDSRIKGGFDNRRHPCLIGSAVASSERNFCETDGQPSLFSTELFLLGKVILEFVGEAIEEILRKLS